MTGDALRYPEETIGRLMDPPAAVFRREQTIAETIEAVRELTKTSFVTYGFVVDDDGRPCGVITMRDLLVSAREQRLLKEALPGLLNGTLVGLTAALGMYVAARAQSHPSALVLAVIVFCAMIGSCIVLTTATDVASMGLFLTLATILIR